MMSHREVYCTFADDTAVMAIGETTDISTGKLRSAVNKVAIWTRK
jgi:hypothetical protein